MNALEAKQFQAAIKGAVARLGRSERGRQALKDFRAMLHHGATSLDCENMAALLILLEGVRIGLAGSVLEAATEQIEQSVHNAATINAALGKALAAERGQQ